MSGAVDWQPLLEKTIIALVSPLGTAWFLGLLAVLLAAWGRRRLAALAARRETLHANLQQALAAARLDEQLTCLWEAGVKHRITPTALTATVRFFSDHL